MAMVAVPSMSAAAMVGMSAATTAPARSTTKRSMGAAPAPARRSAMWSAVSGATAGRHRPVPPVSVARATTGAVAMAIAHATIAAVTRTMPMGPTGSHVPAPATGRVGLGKSIGRIQLTGEARPMVAAGSPTAVQTVAAITVPATTTPLIRRPICPICPGTPRRSRRPIRRRLTGRVRRPCRARNTARSPASAADGASGRSRQWIRRWPRLPGADCPHPPPVGPQRGGSRRPPAPRAAWPRAADRPGRSPRAGRPG